VEAADRAREREHDERANSTPAARIAGVCAHRSSLPEDMSPSRSIPKARPTIAASSWCGA